MDNRAAEDRDLENLIFNEKKEQTAPNDGVRRVSTDETEPRPQHDDEETEAPQSGRKSLKFDRASLVNVLPVDKLKNGANTASKVFGQTFSTIKEKTSAAYETAKSSNAGSAIATGLNRAAAAGSEGINKVKETEAFKKTSIGASIALEKAKATASVGLEKAKSGAATGIETIKSKVGSNEKKGE
ncbi:hypothetical protein PINS_up015049 [Pythium insidiosum]|nr:hypothetical protein PINS_up015049 [Pythium insidiosum]